MTKDTGGPAFPVASGNFRNKGYQYGYEGMTLWQWYAGQALVGILSGRIWENRNTASQWPGSVAEACNIADAMIAEIRKREGV